LRVAWSLLGRGLESQLQCQDARIAEVWAGARDRRLAAGAQRCLGAAVFG